MTNTVRVERFALNLEKLKLGSTSRGYTMKQYGFRFICSKQDTVRVLPRADYGTHPVQLGRSTLLVVRYVEPSHQVQVVAALWARNNRRAAAGISIRVGLFNAVKI